MADTRVAVGESIEVRAEKYGGAGYTEWLPAAVTSLDEPVGFFVTVDGPYGRMEGALRLFVDEGKYWRRRASEVQRG